MVKKRRRRTSLITKGLNILTLAIGISPLIQHFMGGGKLKGVVDGYSAGLTSGSFSQSRAIQWYGPMLAAILFRKAVSMLRKSAKV